VRELISGNIETYLFLFNIGGKRRFNYWNASMWWHRIIISRYMLLFYIFSSFMRILISVRMTIPYRQFLIFTTSRKWMDQYLFSLSVLPIIERERECGPLSSLTFLVKVRFVPIFGKQIKDRSPTATCLSRYRARHKGSNSIKERK